MALDVQRDHDKHDEIIRRDDWRDRTTLQRNITPGPGEYIAKSELDAKGGSWSRYTPKSDVDWMMYHAKQIPGPGQYCVENPYPIKGGSWSRYSPKSDLDWMIHRASQLPGCAPRCTRRRRSLRCAHRGGWWAGRARTSRRATPRSTCGRQA